MSEKTKWSYAPQKWEYRSDFLPSIDKYAAFVDEANRFGREGWEVCATSSMVTKKEGGGDYEYHTLVVFKRPMAPG